MKIEKSSVACLNASALHFSIVTFQFAFPQTRSDRLLAVVWQIQWVPTASSEHAVVGVDAGPVFTLMVPVGMVQEVQMFVKSHQLDMAILEQDVTRRAKMDSPYLFVG